MGRLTTYSSSYPSSAGTPVSGSQSRTVNFMVQLKVPATAERAGSLCQWVAQAQRGSSDWQAPSALGTGLGVTESNMPALPSRLVVPKSHL